MSNKRIISYKNKNPHTKKYSLHKVSQKTFYGGNSLDKRYRNREDIQDESYVIISAMHIRFIAA